MPPYAAMSSTEPRDEAENQIKALSPKGRERELLAMLATKDSRIQQLEEKLAAQAAFIDAVLKLSDDYKATTNSKGKARRVSWAASVDQAADVRKSVNRKSLLEINIDDILDEEDDLSILSEEEDSPRKLAMQEVDVDDGAGLKAAAKAEKAAMLKAQEEETEEEKAVKQAQSSVVQAIIDGMRNDDDSISV